ncbi:MAG: hypothetical protein HOC71_17380 [Candidatus Latescibacteria bacterium]|jgi:N-acylglucosamine 2-epimerase|nr:hypothetical protein [Candidatus Latescibacterota bacterium]
MKRRDFMGTALTAGLTGTLSAYAKPTIPPTTFKTGTYKVLPAKIAGMSLEELRDDYHDRLLNRYLPFWDRGGYDSELGGFMCELYDNGSVQNDEKYIWYQGRGVWVYSFLYNNFGKDPRWLAVAKKSRDFMVKHMHAGNGMWHEAVNRSGKVMKSSGQGTSEDIYGAMFAATGLAEYYKAAGKEEDIELAKTSILTSAKRYNDPDYGGVRLSGYPKRGLRSQGHSFMMVWTLTQLLNFHDDPLLDELAREHLDHIMNSFWNPDYGISNEILEHDYSRISSIEKRTSPGHTIETQWMAMYEAIRIGNGTAFNILKTRVRRILEMSWDYIFEGMGDTMYHVFAGSDHPAGPVFEVKTMWAHCEILIACMTILEYTGDVWAKEWYERARGFTLRAMTTDHGVWRQAVDRFGEDKKRESISIYRMGNFHQPRYMMMNMLSLDRMIKNEGKLTRFPL